MIKTRPSPSANVLARLDDTVAGHDDGSGELGKLKLLQLPSTAVVASKVGVLFQLWVAVGRQLRESHGESSEIRAADGAADSGRVGRQCVSGVFPQKHRQRTISPCV